MIKPLADAIVKSFLGKVIPKQFENSSRTRELNKSLFYQYVVNDLSLDKIAAMYGINKGMVDQIIYREFVKYMKLRYNNVDYFEGFTPETPRKGAQ